MENDMPAPTGAEVWRDFVTDMVPSSGVHQPSKADARAWSAWLESLVTSGVLSSGPWFATQASMTLGYAANAIAVVYADPDAAKNGLYRKNGASGSGSWSQLTSFLPGYQFVTASPTGASTPNAIVAVTSPRLPAGDGVALVTLPIPATNTASPVTVAFDGGAPLTIKDVTGADIVAGGVMAGMMVAGFRAGGSFRLITDYASAAHQAAAKEWANNGEDVPVSTMAGGDGITSFSARHWAAKSDEQADRSEVAREGSEAARDIAGSYANTSVQGGTGNSYGVVAGLSALDIPVGVTTFYATGYAAEGDAGSLLPLVEITEDGSTLQKGQVQTNSGTRRWEYTAARFGPVPAAAFGSFTGTALQDANDYMSRNGGGEVYLPSGSASVISETVALSLGVTIKGGKGSSLQPGEVMDSLISTAHGLTQIKDIKIENVLDRASYAVTVDKPGDDVPVEICGNYISGFTRAVNWLDGDRLILDNNTFVNNGLAMETANDCRNSQITHNYSIGGSGFNFQKATQGAEGVQIVANIILPAIPGAYCIGISHMLESYIGFNILDQIVDNGSGVTMDASIHGDGSIKHVKLDGNWLGRQAGSSAKFGLYMFGPVRYVTSMNNTYVGFRDAGIHADGGTGLNVGFRSIFDTFDPDDRSLRDIELENAVGVLIDGASLTGTATIVENANVSGRVVNSSFDGSRPAIDLGLKYGLQRRGMELRSKGIVNIPDGLVGIFEHGLDYIPSVADIRLTLASFSPNGTGDLVVPVANINETTITVSPRIAAGGAIDVGWEVDMTR